MTYPESHSGGGGHMHQALPGLTPGVKLLIIINMVGLLVTNVPGIKTDWVAFSFHGIADGYGLGSLRIITYQFFHSLDIMHLVWNMLFLYFFGTMVEGRPSDGYAASYMWLGRKRLIQLYLVSGIAGGLGHVMMGAMLGQNMPVIGASGSVYGVMVYAACVYPRRVLHLIFISIELRYLVGFFVFLGVYWSYQGLIGEASRGVSDGAHLGGALWGFLAFKLARRGFSFAERGPIAWWRRKRHEHQVRSARRQQETLDKLLDKVHRQGMSALTPAERRFLERVSKNARK